jgi:RNA polymerase sigma-70 factor (ECF subfamily)
VVTQDRVQPEPVGSVPGLQRVPPADELDETTLVVRAQEGDPNAFEALARRHQAALYRVAVRVMGDPVEAEDALQEALIDAWRRIDRFRTDSSFATWMYRIVTNRCLSLLRRRRPVPVGDINDRRPAPDDPGRSAELDAGLSALGRAVLALPDELRVCWVLRELAGLSYLDIAQITQASEDAVRGRIHRARVRLAEVMASWR